MTENTRQILDGVAETLLITLYVRAMESQRPDALIKGDKAVARSRKQATISRVSSRSGWTTREQVETRIRWEPRAGQIRRHYDNIIAPAISEQGRLFKLSGQYQLNLVTAYRPEQVKGALLHISDLPPESAWPLAFR